MSTIFDTSTDKLEDAFWVLCGGWTFDAFMDQWWAFTATCEHGQYSGESGGSIGLSEAMTTALRNAQRIPHERI